MIDRDLEPPPSPETPLQACLTAGERAIDENRWPEAVKWLVKARELIPADTAVLGKLGFCLSRNQEYQRAIEVFTDLSTREPKVARWPYMVGYQYYVQSQWAEALRWFDKALSIQPTYLIVLYRKGITHLRMGRPPVRGTAGKAEQLLRSLLPAGEDILEERPHIQVQAMSDLGC